MERTLPSELARRGSRNSLGRGCLFFFPLLPGLLRSDATAANAAEVTLLGSCSLCASGSGTENMEMCFLGVLCNGPGEKLRADEATFPLEGEAGSEVRLSRASRTEYA
jgi:hypothetical protein